MMNIVRTMLMLLFILVVWHGCAAARADSGDVLLSRNATYRVTGGGYVYAGQIQPGINARAKKDGMVFAPLVEATDSGDELIDGDTGDESLVNTTWHWDQPGKVIDVEMTLPGESMVHRVVVTYPQDTIYRPEQVALETRESGKQWRKHGRQFVHHQRDPVDISPTSSTFELDDVRCGELKFSVGGFLERVGITEIEVWGDGPTQNNQRGLIRATPHVQTVNLPVMRFAQGAVKLSASATIQLETSHPLTGGEPASLINGNRRDGIRMGGRPHQHWHVTAELDLGDTHHINAVYVWMPGGRGIETGHVHEVTLAISPSTGHLDWQSPVDPLVPLYWPTDDAPRPYVIPASQLNVPGRRVRVKAYLSGTGGVTSWLALGEIEVWGRPMESPATDMPRLVLKPVTIEPEPIAKLAPRWQALRKQRIRGIWIGGDLDNVFGDTGKTKAKILADAGFNTVVLYMGVDRNNRSTAPELVDRIERNVAQARLHDLLVLAKWQFGTTHQEPYRRFRGRSGVEHDRSACPQQPDYIERHVGRWAVKCARLGADGFTFDTEMYESDSTRYPSACYCDPCFKQYLQAYSTDWEHHFNHIEPAQRGQWITGNGVGNHYNQAQRSHLITMFDGIRARCRAINPEFLLAYAPFVGYMSGMTHGLGTPSRPVIVWSEREYTHGPESRTVGFLKRVHDEQLPVLYTGGHMLWYQNPKTLADNLVVAALHTDGWWAWFGSALLTYPGTDDPLAYQSPYGRAAGTTAMDYLSAIKAAHDRLDQLLDEPADRWPRAEMFADVPSTKD